MPLAYKRDFLRKYNHAAKDFSATCLQWKDLRQIYLEHVGLVGALGSAGKYVADRLLQCPAIHTVGWRVKDAEHLIDKIVRKSIHKSAAWATLANYGKVVTDLVGVRGLYLFHNEWPTINTYILNTWTLKQRPEANVRKSDPEEYKKIFRQEGCRVIERSSGYRSVHYLVKFRPTRTEQIVEVQVRSLFEQAASEADHKVRYPSLVREHDLNNLVEHMQRAAALGDGISTLLRLLGDYLLDQQQGKSARARRDALGTISRKRQQVGLLYDELVDNPMPNVPSAR
jgi:putative GTP pyrophosphokinase